MKTHESTGILAIFALMMPLLLFACGKQDASFRIRRVNCVSVSINDPVWEGVDSTETFFAPWDNLSDHTVFQCFASLDTLFFRFSVEDTSITLANPFLGESSVEPEDRVEIFFSPGTDMADYKCAEIDPEGRVLDYQASYYRQMDYDWDFTTLKLDSRIHDKGYIVFGRIALDELEEYGNDVVRGFWMGVFRADYRPDGTVNWYSLKPTDDEQPDFHKSNVLFLAKIDQK